MKELNGTKLKEKGNLGGKNCEFKDKTSQHAKYRRSGAKNTKCGRPGENFQVVIANHKETKLQKRQSEVVRTKSNPPPVDDEVESRVNENPTQTLENERIGVNLQEEMPNTRVN
ncbi:hypothetical protein J1N35_037092, partial [Gossypium stocksii]